MSDTYSNEHAAHTDRTDQLATGIHTDATNQGPVSDGFFRTFKSHPASVGENYFTHALFALRFGARLSAAGMAALVHGFIPPLFETTASRIIRQMNDELMERHTTS